ncbi:MAG: DUF177 domain-containing protein [Peptococcaceae bacterium]|nr:DUF177 domain-containing protein [Peptococcaceae bacterium]
MLQLDVTRLKRSPGDSARYDLLADLPPLDMPGERVAFAGPVKAGLDVTNTGRALAVRGEVSGRLRLTCSRCLEPFERPFQAAFEETYTPLPEEGGEDTVPFSGDIIDLTPEVLKCIIMALPMKAVCREECPGLCPGCGKSLKEGPCGCGGGDIDPRFSVLKNFFREKQ